MKAFEGNVDDPQVSFSLFSAVAKDVDRWKQLVQKLFISENDCFLSISDYKCERGTDGYIAKINFRERGKSLENRLQIMASEGRLWDYWTMVQVLYTIVQKCVEAETVFDGLDFSGKTLFLIGEDSVKISPFGQATNPWGQLAPVFQAIISIGYSQDLVPPEMAQFLTDLVEIAGRSDGKSLFSWFQEYLQINATSQFQALNKQILDYSIRDLSHIKSLLSLLLPYHQLTPTISLSRTCENCKASFFLDTSQITCGSHFVCGEACKTEGRTKRGISAVGICPWCPEGPRKANLLKKQMMPDLFLQSETSFRSIPAPRGLAGNTSLPKDDSSLRTFESPPTKAILRNSKDSSKPSRRGKVSFEDKKKDTGELETKFEVDSSLCLNCRAPRTEDWAYSMLCKVHGFCSWDCERIFFQTYVSEHVYLAQNCLVCMKFEVSYAEQVDFQPRLDTIKELKQRCLEKAADLQDCITLLNKINELFGLINQHLSDTDRWPVVLSPRQLKQDVYFLRCLLCNKNIAVHKRRVREMHLWPDPPVLLKCEFNVHAVCSRACDMTLRQRNPETCPICPPARLVYSLMEMGRLNSHPTIEVLRRVPAIACMHSEEDGTLTVPLPTCSHEMCKECLANSLCDYQRRSFSCGICFAKSDAEKLLSDILT